MFKTSTWTLCRTTRRNPRNCVGNFHLRLPIDNGGFLQVWISYLCQSSRFKVPDVLQKSQTYQNVGNFCQVTNLQCVKYQEHSFVVKWLDNIGAHAWSKNATNRRKILKSIDGFDRICVLLTKMPNSLIKWKPSKIHLNDEWSSGCWLLGSDQLLTYFSKPKLIDIGFALVQCFGSQCKNYMLGSMWKTSRQMQK